MLFYNPSTPEAEVGEWWMGRQPRLHSESLLSKNIAFSNQSRVFTWKWLRYAAAERTKGTKDYTPLQGLKEELLDLVLRTFCWQLNTSGSSYRTGTDTVFPSHLQDHNRSRAWGHGGIDSWDRWKLSMGSATLPGLSTPFICALVSKRGNVGAFTLIQRFWKWKGILSWENWCPKGGKWTRGRGMRN